MSTGRHGRAELYNIDSYKAYILRSTYIIIKQANDAPLQALTLRWIEQRRLRSAAYVWRAG